MGTDFYNELYSKGMGNENGKRKKESSERGVEEEVPAILKSEVGNTLGNLKDKIHNSIKALKEEQAPFQTELANQKDSGNLFAAQK